MERDSYAWGDATARFEENQLIDQSLTQAFEQVVNAPECAALLQEVRETCAYRAQFPWLPESGECVDDEYDDNIVHALRYALRSYVPKENELAHISPAIVELAHISPEQERFLQVINHVTYDTASITGFSHGLKRAGLDMMQASSEQIAPHITEALRDYCAMREAGTSPDPW